PHARSAGRVSRRARRDRSPAPMVARITRHRPARERAAPSHVFRLMKTLTALLRTFAFATLLLSAAHAATTVVRGPYLQTATPTSMVVRWRTDMTEASIVSYGTERDQLTSTA